MQYVLYAQANRFAPSHTTHIKSDIPLRPSGSFPPIQPPSLLPAPPPSFYPVHFWDCTLTINWRRSLINILFLSRPPVSQTPNGPFLRRKHRPFGPNYGSAGERDPRTTSVSRTRRGGCEEDQRADRRSPQGRTRRKENQTKESTQGPPPGSKRERYVSIQSFLKGCHHPTRPFSPLPPLSPARFGFFVTNFKFYGCIFSNSVLSIIRMFGNKDVPVNNPSHWKLG